MKNKLIIEVECNGAFQRNLVESTLKNIEEFIDYKFQNHDYLTPDMLFTSYEAEEFPETMTEKQASMYLGMTYKNFRYFRQSGTTVAFHKKGKSFMYHKADLDKVKGKDQWETRSNISNLQVD